MIRDTPHIYRYYFETTRGRKAIGQTADNMRHFAVIINGSDINHRAGYAFRRKPGFPYYTLSLIIEGRYRIKSGSGRQEIQPHTLLLIPPNTPYVASVLAPGREVWMFLAPPAEWQPLLDWNPPRQAPRCCFTVAIEGQDLRSKITRIMQDAVEFRTSHLEAGARLAELAVEQVLVLGASLAKHGDALDDRLQSVLQALRRDLARPWREAEMAALANLSTSRFAHLFREKLGIPPVRYLERMRMDAAKALLLSTVQPVKAISAEFGYPDPLYFSARFRHVVGVSPRRYRERGGTGKRRTA